MIRPVGNQNFYKTLLGQQIAETARRNNTSIDMGRIILENNKRLCSELNVYNKAVNPNSPITYLLDLSGQFIKSFKDKGVVKVADNEILRIIEKIRAVK